jgi:hypothetical protein
MGNMFAFLLVSAGLIFGPARAHAFPEMVRAGYTNCTTCHVSPTGGGILTDYGRNLSNEVLSTWGTEREAQPLHGLLPDRGESKEDTKWFGVGGDVRAVQVHSENSLAKINRFIWMQAMADFAYRYDTWTAEISVGKYDQNRRGEWVANAERYYLMKQFGEANLIRVGRVIPAFGLNVPEHIAPTRGGPRGNGLGFGIAQERDVAEWHYIGETWNAAVGYSKGPRDDVSPLEEAFYGQIQRAFAEHYKIGLSAWSGKRETDKRRILGVHGALGFTKQFYMLTETDVQFDQPNAGDSTTGIYGYHKVGYEFHKGIHVFMHMDHMQPNLKQPSTFSSRWGPGMAFFPRPHFELNAVWARELVKSTSDHEGDYAWLLLHYYL